MTRPSVDLPEPDSPTRPSVSPFAIVKLTLSTALSTRLRNRLPRTGKCFDTPSTRHKRHLGRRHHCASASATFFIITQQRAAWPGVDRVRAPARPCRSASIANGQRGWNLQPGRQVARIGRLAADREQSLPIASVDARHGAQQRPRVGMLRRAEDRLRRALLDDPPRVHHEYPRAQARDQRDIVGDQQDRGAGVLVELAHQRDDLVLDSHVERGGRLVGDQQCRTVGDSHRDHCALAHAAGIFVRIAARALMRCCGIPTPLQQVEHAAADRGGRELGVQTDRLGELCADPQHRIERGHRVLEYHRDALPAHLPHLRLRQAAGCHGRGT